MKLPLSLLSCVAVLATSAPALAESSASFGGQPGVRSGQELPPYLQCVPYAREVSGIQIYGDAHTWWDQAEGRFARGNQPKVGAVLAFRPHRNMQLGHVAAVSKVIDSRTVLLRHANWSPINGRRGQIENDVKAVDVSPRNDWSEVRVWYHPLQALGKTAWPVHGFIYSDKAPKFDRPFAQSTQIARAAKVEQPVVKVEPARTVSSAEFRNAFASLAGSSRAAPPRAVHSAPVARQTAAPRPVRAAATKVTRASDPVRAAVSLYD